LKTLGKLALAIQQIVTKLSPEVWLYEGKQTYVLTHRECENQSEITAKHSEYSHFRRKFIYDKSFIRLPRQYMSFANGRICPA